MFVDFGALPPEINSGRMYAGPGPGPMLAAAAAWDALAAELHSTASSYGTTVEGLAVGPWQGPASAAMMGAAAPYVAWMTATAVQAEQAGMQAKAAAAAHETAFAATVPPPVIDANRSLLMALVATNVFGQNTPAIAATEAHYAEMWAQDAVAMYAYAASSATATRLTPFTEPPQTTDAAAAAAQAGAVTQAASQAAVSDIQSQLSSLINVVPNVLQGLGATPLAATPAGSIIDAIYPVVANIRPLFTVLTGPYSPVGGIILPGGWWLFALQGLGLSQNAPGVGELLSGGKGISGALAPLRTGYISQVTPAPGSGAAGYMGHSTLVGSLSVPQGWVTAAPVMRTLASVLPAATVEALPTGTAVSPGALFGGMAAASLAGRALAGAAVRTAGATGTTGVTGVGVADDLATTATIIVIPAD